MYEVRRIEAYYPPKENEEIVVHLEVIGFRFGCGTNKILKRAVIEAIFDSIEKSSELDLSDKLHLSGTKETRFKATLEGFEEEATKPEMAMARVVLSFLNTLVTI